MNPRLLALLPVAACVAAPPRANLAAPAPAFDPAAFFSGPTEGTGDLDVALKGHSAVHVHGQGHLAPDGSLVLAQTVERAGEPAKQREWHLRQTAPGRWEGSLSDAAGPVLATTQGNALHILFPMKGGLTAEQWLYLQPGGQTALNRMTIAKWGMRVAALEETIRRVG